MSRPGGRAVAEQLLQAIDNRGLSVADVAVDAGLPVAEVEQLLHREPGRLDLRLAYRLADALGVPLSKLADRAQQALDADPRDVLDGGQTVTVWREQQPDATGVLLDQVVDVDGPDAILGREQVRNGSGRVVGDRYTVTTDAAQAIRAALTAGVEASQG